MSARAAWRLETLGFDRVYRYQPGKDDWFAAGLPREGALAARPRAADAVNPDTLTCAPQDSIGEVQRRMHETGTDLCVVVNDRRIVLGVVREPALNGDPNASIDEVLDPGPLTYRPHTLLTDIVKRMEESQGRIRRVLVTTSDGELIGLLRRADAEAYLNAKQRGTRQNAA
jgi:CBS domain-containing protein